MSSKWGFKSEDRKLFTMEKFFYKILSHTLYQVTQLDILWRDLCYESCDNVKVHV